MQPSVESVPPVAPSGAAPFATTLFSPVVPSYSSFNGSYLGASSGVAIPAATSAPAQSGTSGNTSHASGTSNAKSDGKYESSSHDAGNGSTSDKKKSKTKKEEVKPLPTDQPFSAALMFPGARGFLPPPPANFSVKKLKKKDNRPEPSTAASAFKVASNMPPAIPQVTIPMMHPPTVLAPAVSASGSAAPAQPSSSISGPALILPAALPVTPASALTEGKGKGDFVCPVCSKEFVTKGSLKTHSRVHTGERPYACPLCPKGFTQQANCSRHIRLMHRDSPNSLPIKIPDPPKLAVPVIKVPKTKKAKQKLTEAIAARNASSAVIAAVKDAPPGAVFFPPNVTLFTNSSGTGTGVPPPPPPPPQASGLPADGKKKKKKSKKKGTEESSSAPKRAKATHESETGGRRIEEGRNSGHDMMFDAQQHMQGGAAQYNVLSSHYPYGDWNQQMRSPLMGASNNSGMQGSSSAAAASMPPAMTLDWQQQFRSKSPPSVYSQNQNAAGPQDWMMRSKSPMPNAQPNAAAAAAAAYSYPMIPSDMTSMYPQDQMYNPIMYTTDPSASYGMMHAPQLSPNSQRKMAMAAAAEYQNAVSMGFPGYFSQQQTHPGYLTYGGPGDVSGAHTQQGVSGHMSADPYGAFEFAGQFDMGDHAAMMMPGGASGQPGHGHEHE